MKQVLKKQLIFGLLVVALAVTAGYLVDRSLAPFIAIAGLVIFSLIPWKSGQKVSGSAGIDDSYGDHDGDHGGDHGGDGGSG